MQTIRIFVSSPGDVGEERRVAREVIERLQGKYWSFVRLDDVFWEQKVVRSTAHYQDELENPGLCDIVVGVLWSRAGSPLPAKFQPPGGKVPLTGTTWELEEAFAAFEASGHTKPDIIIYQCTRSRPVPEDPEQAQAALNQGRELDAYLTENYFFADGTIKRPVTLYDGVDEFRRKLEANLEELIMRKLPAMKRGFEPPPVSGSPFKGLQPFTFADSDRYFGRNREIREIQDLFRQRADKGRPFVLIYGGSGYGKSSLMQAGLVPVVTRPGGALEGMGFWRTVFMQPALGVGTLVGRLVSVLLQEMAQEEIAEMRRSPELPVWRLPEALGKWGAAEALAHALSDEATRETAVEELGVLLEGLDRHLLVQVDQLEEVFTTPGITAEQRSVFFRTLAAFCASGRIWVVATMRSEYFPRIAEESDLRELVGKDGGYILPPPDRQSLREIIRFPALAARLDYQRRISPVEVAGEQARFEDLDDQVLADAEASADALPLLEFTLQRLYDERSGSLLVWESYASFGGLKGAVAHRANEVFATLDAGAREARHVIFAALVKVDPARGTVVRQRAPLEVLAIQEGVEPFIRSFLAAHLLVTDAEQSRPVVTLAHESLISHWDELAAWVDTHRGDLLARQRLREQARLWVENGRQKSYLLSEARLAEAQRVGSRSIFTLEEDEREFLRLSGRRAKAKLRFFQGAAVVFALLAAASAFAGWYARKQEQAAILSRDKAEDVMSLMVFGLRDKLGPIGRLDIVEDVQKMAADYYATLGVNESNTKQLTNFITSLHSRGDLLAERGEIREAEAVYTQACELARKLVKLDAESREANVSLALSLTRMGGMATRAGRVEEGAARYEEARALLVALAKRHPKDAYVHSYLADVLASVADAESDRGNLLDASGNYERVLNLRERLLEYEPDEPSRKRDLARALNQMAYAFKKSGLTEKAAENFQRSLDLRRGLVEASPRDADVRMALYYAMVDMADLRETQGRLVDAVALRSEAHGIMVEMVAQDPTNATWRRQFALSLDGQGLLRKKQGRMAEAASMFDEALVIFRDLCAKSPQDTEAAADLVTELRRAGDARQSMGRMEEALALEREGLTLARQLVEKDPANEVLAGGLRLALTDVGVACTDLGKQEEGETLLREALVIARRLAEKDQLHFGRRNDLAWALTNLARAILRAGKRDEARSLFAEALEVEEALVHMAPEQKEWKRDKGVFLVNLADMLAAQGDAAGAKRHHEESLAIRRSLVAGDPGNNRSEMDLMISLERCGMLRVSEGRMEEALAFFREDVDIIRRNLAADRDSTAWRRSLGIGLLKITDVLIPLGRFPEAEVLIAEFVDVSRALVRLDAANPLWRSDLGVALAEQAKLKALTGHPAEATVLYQEALTVQRKVVEDAPANLDYRRSVCLTLDEMAKAASARLDATGALQLYMESLTEKRAIMALDPSSLQCVSDCMNSMNSICDQLSSLGRTEEAAALADESVGLGGKLLEGEPANPVYRSNLGDALVSRGGVRVKRNDNDAALEDYRQALELFRELARTGDERYRGALVNVLLNASQVLGWKGEDAGEMQEEALAMVKSLVEGNPANTRWRGLLGSVQESRGNYLLKAGRKEEARAAFTESLGVRKKLAEDAPDSPGLQRSLMVGYYNAAIILADTGDADAAIPVYQTAVGIIRAALDKPQPHPIWKKDLRNTLERLARAMFSRGDYAGSRRVLEEYIGLRRAELQEKPGDVIALRWIGKALARIAGGEDQQGHGAEAAAKYAESISIAREVLAKEPDDEDWRRDLVDVLEDAAWNLDREKRPEDCAAIRRELVAFLSTQVERAPEDGKWQARHAKNLVDAGDLFWSMNRREDAHTMYLARLVSLRKYAETRPSDAEAWGHVAESLKMVIMVDTLMELDGEREKLLVESIAVRRRLMDLQPESDEARREYVTSILRQGEYLFDAGREKEGEAVFAEAEAFCRARIAKDASAIQWRSLQADIAQAYADLRVDQQAWAKAEPLLREVLAIRREVVKRTEGVWESRLSLARSLQSLADMLRRSRRFAEAEPLYQEAAGIARGPDEAEGSRMMGRFLLSSSLQNLGRIWMETGKPAAAEKVFRENCSLQREILSFEPENPDFKEALTEGLRQLGDSLGSQGRSADAGTAYAEAMAIARAEMKKTPDHARWQEPMMILLDRAGVQALDSGDLKMAAEAFRESLAIQRDQLAADVGHPSVVRNFAVALARIADLERMEGRPASAATLLDEAISHLGTAIAAHPQDAKLQSALRGHLVERARDLAATGDPRKARADLAKAMDLATRLAKREPANRDWKTAIIATWQARGEIELAVRQPRAAVEAFSTAAGLLRKSPPAPEGDLSQGEATARVLLGEGAALLEQGNVKSARARLADALTQWRKQLEAAPSNLAWQRQLAVTTNLLADPRFNDPSAPAGLAQSLEVARRLATLSPTHATWSVDLAAALYFSGIVRKDAGLLEEAASLIGKLAASGVLDTETKGWPALFQATLEKVRGGAAPTTFSGVRNAL